VDSHWRSNTIFVATVAMYTRPPEIKAVGVVMNIQSYAGRELHRLGLASELVAAAMQPLAIAYASSTGKILFREPSGFNAGSPVPQYSIHWPMLHRIRLEAVAQRLGPDADLSDMGRT
jgi:2-polyprenyl-6-methoxyphenol hydroxylase-like FAD-dependent oxidoreductase